MFDKKVYIQRREALRNKCGKGLLLLPGNKECAMNYLANTYPFRQDSNYLYFFGLDKPDLAAIIDFEENRDTIYGDDLGIDDIIWMGEQPLLSETALKVGIDYIKPLSFLKADIQKAIKAGRQVKILPPYRGEQYLLLSELLDTDPAGLKDFIGADCIKAIVSLREIKDDNEVDQIEFAVDVACKMHTAVMKMAFPGIRERELAGMIEGIALANSGAVSFPIILSVDGQTLHNHSHGNLLSEGRMLVTDAGCESPLHYASDITRTIPVGGKFSRRQKDVYEIVLAANLKAIESVKPGIYNKDLHFIAARIIAEGLKNLGLMKGDMEEAVNQGAHALFFPHGLGHMLGLDVHDMESLGENNVGYDENISRSAQFGTAYLRLAKELKPGFVLTIEPGIYFIPALIDLWKKEKRAESFINYNKVESYKNFGGIRIEDDVLVTPDGNRILGNPIPKTIQDIEKVIAG